jgi:hypothetical protein
MMSRSALAIIGVSADVLLVGGWLADWLGRIAGCPQLLQNGAWQAPVSAAQIVAVSRIAPNSARPNRRVFRDGHP